MLYVLEESQSGAHGGSAAPRVIRAALQSHGCPSTPASSDGWPPGTVKVFPPPPFCWVCFPWESSVHSKLLGAEAALSRLRVTLLGAALSEKCGPYLWCLCHLLWVFSLCVQGE
jgi:hypothetical protein